MALIIICLILQNSVDGISQLWLCVVVKESACIFITFFLQYFNSRSCQLVLGAGALQVVGLKTITTKNLGMDFYI